VAKKRKANAKTIRVGIRKQLGYIRRNLRHIKELSRTSSLGLLGKGLYRELLVVSELYRQQRKMHERRLRSVSGRIVSIAQPHVRPIVRGKAGVPTEFGAKVSVSLVDGYCFLEKLSWDPYNEGGEIISHIEEYKKRFGYYPESVHADRIYRTRENRAFCQDRGIRISGPPLGRPPKDREQYRDNLKQALADERDRIAIEGAFGVGKRRYGLGRIKAKLQVTSETSISLTVLVMNLEKSLRVLLLSIFRFLQKGCFFFKIVFKNSEMR